MIPEHARLEAVLRDLMQKPHMRNVPNPTHTQRARWAEYIAAIGTNEAEAAWRRWCEVARPFDGYVDQPDTASRKRSAEFDRIPFALPEKRDE